VRSMIVQLTFVVNGEEVQVAVAAEAPLHLAVIEALHKSKNTARPPEEWELRYETGALIPDQSQPVESYKFPPGTHLYLTLRVGAGGDVSRSGS
jgi:Protein of Unknown function (DUF2604)